MPEMAQPVATVTPRKAGTGPVPLPSALTYGTVSWAAVGLAEDTASDIDSYPDAKQINGWATFTAQPKKIVRAGVEEPVTVLPVPLRYQILSGRLIDQEGRTEISLVGNDSPGTTPQGWSYHVDWELNDGITFGSFDFPLAGGEVVDLSDVQPLDEPSPGVIITKGETGDQGDPGDLTPSYGWNAATGLVTLLDTHVPSTHPYTLAGNLTVALNPGPVGKSGTVTLVLKQAAAGGPFTVTWPGTLEWAGDALGPAMPTIPNSELVVHLFWTGAVWRAFAGGLFFP